MSSASLMDLDRPYEAVDNAKWFDLVPDRNLLDSNFEGYKLCLEPFANYKINLTDEFKLDTYNFIEDDNSTQRFFLFQHLKLIGLQNLIVVNQFNDANIYYFDSKFRLIKIVYNTAHSMSTSRNIWATNLQLDDLVYSKTNRVNVTMKFIDIRTAVIFDGYETLYICQIDENSPVEAENWNIMFKYSTSGLEKFGLASILKDALLVDSNQLHLLFMNVQEKNESCSYKFETLVNWLSFERTTGGCIWNLNRVRRLNCFNSVPDYLSLETNGQSVFVAGPSFIKYEYDSVKPVAQLARTKTEPKFKTAEVKAEKFYTWNQTANEINLHVTLLNAVEIQKGELSVSINYDSLVIVYANEVVIKENFYSPIKTDESVWTLNKDVKNNLIEFVLTKANAEIWPVCLKNNDIYGEYKQSDDNMNVDSAEDSKENKKYIKKFFNKI